MSRSPRPRSGHTGGQGPYSPRPSRAAESEGHVALTDQAGRMRCGTELAALITQVAEGAPAADPGIKPSARTVRRPLGRIRELWSDVRALANEPVRAPRGLLDEVIARISGPAGAVTLRDATRGHTQVSEAVVAGVARQIAQAMPAVAFASVLAHAAGPGAVALRVRLMVPTDLRYPRWPPRCASRLSRTCGA